MGLTPNKPLQEGRKEGREERKKGAGIELFRADHVSSAICNAC